MWNGAPGSITASAFARASTNGSTVRNAPSEVACMCAKSSTGRTQSSRDAISTTSSIEPRSRTRPITSIPNGTRDPCLPAAPQLAELLDDRVDRLLTRPAEQEPGVEDDQLGARGLRDSGRVVEHPDRHVELLPALGVSHEAGNRRMHRQGDVVLARESPKSRGEVVVHPEPSLEVDSQADRPRSSRDRQPLRETHVTEPWQGRSADGGSLKKNVLVTVRDR